MNPRILHLYEPTPQSPYLSAKAAANHWLPTALRNLDYEVVARPLPEMSPETIAELSTHFDLVHVFGELPAGTTLQSAAVQTVFRDGGGPVPQAALSWRQARKLPAPPLDVTPPGIPTEEVETPLDRGDHLATVFHHGEHRALASAIRVAKAVERELLVLVPPGSGMDSTDPIVRFVEADPHHAPIELISAAAYLAFGDPAADIAAVTALAAGVPTITLDGLAAAETVVSGESGFVCASVEEAIRAAGRLDLLSPKHARARARLLFDTSGWAQRTASLYSALLDGRRPVFRHPEQMAAV